MFLRPGSTFCATTPYSVGQGPTIQLRSTLGALQTRVQMTRAAQLFAVAHEIGHHVFGHAEVGSGQGRSEPMMEEYEADAFAIRASLHVAGAEVPANFCMQSGVGGSVLLLASELVARTGDVLAQRKVVLSTDGMHPPVASRIKNMAHIDMGLDQESTKRFRDARACFATVLELVWNRALPTIEALHDAGVRPQTRST